MPRVLGCERYHAALSIDSVVGVALVRRRCGSGDCAVGVSADAIAINPQVSQQGDGRIFRTIAFPLGSPPVNFAVGCRHEDPNAGVAPALSIAPRLRR